MTIRLERDEALAHVVVVGGTPQSWLEMSPQLWSGRMETLLLGARQSAVQWVTLLPHHGTAFSPSQTQQYRQVIGVSSDNVRKVTQVSVPHGERYVLQDDAGTTLIIDPSPDGHVRFANTVESLRLSGIDPDALTETELSLAILQPAIQEPDLVIILGPPDVLPDSMVWELAYSELVFLDLDWFALTASHLELAIDDFTRRHRRFGGLDS